MVDTDFTEVPAPVFNTWLKDTKDILGNRPHKTKVYINLAQIVYSE